MSLWYSNDVRESIVHSRNEKSGRFPYLAASSIRIPQKNSAFLHDLETCHKLESIQISFGEVHSYPKPVPSYFTTTEWQNNWPFYEKEEAYSSHVMLLHMMKFGDKQLWL